MLMVGLSSCKEDVGQIESISYGLTLSPSGIDPHINASAELGIPLSSVYDTLVFKDPETGDFVPGLAQSWTISPDALTYTFELREDVVFHDGTKFDANSVKANLDYITNPDHLSQKAVLMLGPFERVEVLSEFSAAIHLTEPYAPLLDSLSQVYLGMASPSALEKWGATEYQFHQVGTGPYRFVEYIPNDHLILKKNPDYAWAPSVYRESIAAIDEIVFKFYEDPATRSFALEIGEIDIIGEIPPQEIERLLETGEFEFHPVPIPGQPTQFFFNTAKAPTNDARLREILITALDRPFIVDTIFGPYSPVAEGPLSHQLLSYTTTSPYPDYYPDFAVEQLDKLGWRIEPGSQVRSKDGTPLEISIIAPTWGSNSEVAQLMSATWENLGIQVSLEIAPGFGPLKQLQDSGEYHLIGINFFGTDPDFISSFYSTDGFYNWSGQRDPELDELLSQARAATHDAQERELYYSQISEMIREQAILIPIRDYVNLVVVRSDILGLRFSPQGWFPYLIDLRRAP